MDKDVFEEVVMEIMQVVYGQDSVPSAGRPFDALRSAQFAERVANLPSKIRERF